jgi:hypothetical protein
MDRKQVYELIDGEREYQNRKAERDIESDKDHSVADWVIYIEWQLLQAKEALYFLDKTGALNYVRKIAGLAVACMEVNDTPARLIE